MEGDTGGFSISLPDNQNSNNGTGNYSKRGKALDIMINAEKLKSLLDPWLDRYEENIRFVESVQTGTAKNSALVASMSGLTGGEIVSRCQTRGQFVLDNVNSGILATFSSLRAYRAICDMDRLDQERFMKVLGVFADWNEPQFIDFKHIHTLEYIFRHILQRDDDYKTRFTDFLFECQKSKNLSTITRPVLPMTTPLYVKNTDQLALCSKPLLSKMNRIVRRESSSLSFLEMAVGSFFRQLDLMEKPSGEMARSLGTHALQSETSPVKGLKRKDGSEGSSEMSHSRQPSIERLSKRPRGENNQDVLPQEDLENVATVGTSNRHSTSVLANCPTTATVSDDTRADIIAPEAGITSGIGGLKSEQGPIHTPSQTPRIVAVMSLASLNSSASTPLSGSTDACETISLREVKTEDNLRASSVLSGSGHSLPVSCGSSLEMGINEEVDETGLQSILSSLAGMHAVVPCGDFGNIIQHGSVNHPDYGEILVRRGRVVRLGDAERGFRAPDPQLEFHFPMEKLDDFIPAEKIRFDVQRNMYLDDVMTDFYFLQP